MMYMQDDIRMMTTLDANNQGGGLFGKLMGAGKRLLTGESFFITMFVNEGRQRRDVAFAAPFPGKILAADLGDWGGTLLAQKDSFLCAARGIEFPRRDPACVGKSVLCAVPRCGGHRAANLDPLHQPVEGAHGERRRPRRRTRRDRGTRPGWRPHRDAGADRRRAGSDRRCRGA